MTTEQAEYIEYLSNIEKKFRQLRKIATKKEIRAWKDPHMRFTYPLTTDWWIEDLVLLAPAFHERLTPKAYGLGMQIIYVCRCTLRDVHTDLLNLLVLDEKDIRENRRISILFEREVFVTQLRECSKALHDCERMMDGFRSCLKEIHQSGMQKVAIERSMSMAVETRVYVGSAHDSDTSTLFMDISSSIWSPGMDDYWVTNAIARL